MKKFYWMVLVLGLSFIAVSSVQSKQEEEVVNTIPVAKGIYMLESQGSGNIGVFVGEDGVLIIDDKFAPLAEKIQKSLGILGGGKPKFILNTHWHGDHTGGNEIFGAGGTIIAHDNVRKRLSTKQEIKLFNMVSEPHPKVALPVITFDNSLSVHFNGEEIKVIHFAQGHTDGDSVIFFTQSNVVHLGDHFFNGTYPFIDLNSGGSVQGVIDNIAKILEMIPEDAKIIPGHGPLASVDDLKSFHGMLIETSTLVKKFIAQSKNLKEIKKIGLSEEITSKWAKGFLTTEQWIDILYNSYK
ncbi:MBL-fold metallo-hydrolase superfamily [hydrothermal vent metagenome]|uniref:MBL-fold metallo-hydrolase superfamily n=1 Tax=hydrothermal vent metagenome TaxID=652676 RepID=A0A3B1D6Y8_9ZZZZ